jgi:two-component system phosphate regulon sensor histidine kinase PhoR
MRVSFQVRLAAILTGLVVTVVVVSGVLAERGLRDREIAGAELSLRERAGLVREQVAEVPLERGFTKVLQPLAARAAAAANARVTLIGPDGTVVADSDVPTLELHKVQNHADRPEVQAALSGSIGRVSRRSATVGRRLLYLAIPAASESAGVVRLAADLSEVERAVADLRRTLVVAGGIGVVAAVGLALALAHLMVRPLRRLSDAVAAIASGQLERRVSWRTRDEVGRIADGINRIAEELRERLDEATAEKERLSAVLAGMAEGVLVLDAEGRILLANPRLREFFDVPGPLEGRLPLEVIRRADVDEALREAGSGAPVVRELEEVGPRGATLQVHAIGFPAHGERLGTVAVFHDTSELGRLEAMRREFIANVSHELKTPLTAIQGYAETLAAGGLSPEQQRTFLDVILRHGKRLGALIEDILQLSRIESRKLELNIAPVDLAALAQGVLDDLAARLEKKKLSSTVETRGDPEAMADARSLEQVLLNLLDNAIKYTEEGGAITVSVDGEGPRLRVAVEDTGLGIPLADQDRIFERFYRVDRARSREQGGTGLGLSIVKHLVQANGGDVFLDSQLGRGTRISFHLRKASPRRSG